MERGNDKHSARMDEALERETRGIVQAGRETRAEDWNTSEPSGEDQPDVDRNPSGTLVGGLPDGLTPDDVAGRSELASVLGKEVWPATGPDLLAKATELGATDAQLQVLSGLPAGPSYGNMAELWQALSGGVEQHRS